MDYFQRVPIQPPSIHASRLTADAHLFIPSIYPWLSIDAYGRCISVAFSSRLPPRVVDSTIVFSIIPADDDDDSETAWLGLYVIPLSLGTRYVWSYAYMRTPRRERDDGEKFTCSLFHSSCAVETNAEGNVTFPYKFKA